MSDNEDLLGDDLGDQSLADYNLGNEEEEQLLADDYENGPQNVPNSVGPYREPVDMVPMEYPGHVIEYNTQPMPYPPMSEPECVVPNITVEVPNAPVAERPTYAPYEPRYDTEHAVPPAIPAAPIESPQIVPSDISAPVPNDELCGSRERFVSERPPGTQRMPQIRDIPDSLDKVIIPRGGFPGRGRTTWRSAQFAARFNSHPYRRNNMHRGNFNPRASFPPPQMRHSPPQMRPEMRPNVRPEMRSAMGPPVRPEMRPEMRPNIRHELPPEVRSEMRPDMRPEIRHEMRPVRLEIRPEHPEMRQDIRPDMRPDIRSDMRPENRPEMRPHIRPDMRPDIRPDMRPENRHEMRPEIRHEMLPDIRPDMRPEIHPDMRSDMHPEARLIRINMHSDIRPEMRPDIPREMRPDMRPDIHMEMRPDMRPDMHEMRPDRSDMRSDRHDIHHDMRPELRPPPQLQSEMSPERPLLQMGPEISPEQPILPQDMPMFRHLERPPFPNYRFPYRPNMEERPYRPNFDSRPVFFRPNFPRPFGPIREVAPNTISHMPQVTIRQPLPLSEKDIAKGREPEVRMLPVTLPPTLPPGGLAGKKVLINPHFKGTFQPPVDGPVKDIDDAAERFIAEQRNALARAATRKFARRSPQRFIENTTIEIENELAHAPPPRTSEDDDDLSRRQEEFINANRAGLRRRMRSPSPPRRSLSPAPAPRRRSPLPRRAPAHNDEDSEYSRKMREQETLRERVLRAKEVRRRRNAVALQQQLGHRDRVQDKDKENNEQTNIEDAKPVTTTQRPASPQPDVKPDTTRTTPERIVPVEKKEKPLEKKVVRERSPVKKEDSPEVNSTHEPGTPPRSPRALTPPLPSDDDLDLILGDIDGILSDEDDSGRFKEKPAKTETPKAKPAVDLRTKLPPKPADVDKKQRQKIVFTEEKKKKDKSKSPSRRAQAGSDSTDRKNAKLKQKAEAALAKARQRITFDKKQAEKEEDKQPTAFSNRRVILQRKLAPAKEKSVFSRIEVKSDPTKPNPGIFSRAVRTAIGSENARIVVKKEPEVEYESDSDLDEEQLLDEDIGYVATVKNLPYGMTDTRLKTLAGSDVQTMTLDTEERSAKITFKTTMAADSFKKKFNNKMVAASRLTVTLR